MSVRLSDAHGAYRLIVRMLPEDFRAKRGGDLVEGHVDAWRAEALGRGLITRFTFSVRAFRLDSTHRRCPALAGLPCAE